VNRSCRRRSWYEQGRQAACTRTPHLTPARLNEVIYAPPYCAKPIAANGATTLNPPVACSARAFRKSNWKAGDLKHLVASLLPAPLYRNLVDFVTRRRSARSRVDWPALYNDEALDSLLCEGSYCSGFWHVPCAHVRKLLLPHMNTTTSARTGPSLHRPVGAMGSWAGERSSFATQRL
jgi:hypothetical protein